MDASGDRILGLLVQCRFDSGELNMFTGHGTVAWEGATYLGAAGQMLRIGEAQETSGGEMPGLTLTLSGLDPEVVALAELEEFQRRRVTLRLALFDPEGRIEAADVLWDGLADTLDSDDGPDTATATLACEERAMDLGRKRPFYYLPEDQQRRFPGDRFFDLVQAIQNREDTWGR
ncbi:hypothetical protein BV509_17820 [Rhodovulum sulfidophilum]|uniref:Uncharacterized protein n=1 Tax=Rhodovulum visakhapatnamense TaxID=364297 RepID=A0ABS1RLF6_9RHOB|nr:hypothetical protein [Rhodovulum visakhapatnamense]MBL3571515.1 hypothetical protein [Rhodovulum visakhapatnamense]MBL3580491.1 hypothetical protein [Rhodovulum visakhapatnamense]OLS46029.1 hypothetical protein BV509_17820 [Rhodovulum sulfidophilum]